MFLWYVGFFQISLRQVRQELQIVPSILYQIAGILRTLDSMHHFFHCLWLRLLLDKNTKPQYFILLSKMTSQNCKLFHFCSVFLCTDRVLPAFVGYRADQRTWKYVQDSCLVMQSLELQPDEKGHPDNKGCQIRSQSSSLLRQPSPTSQGVGLTCSWVVISNRNDTKQHYIVPNSSLR